MGAGTLSEQRAELEAAATIARVFPHLPAAMIHAPHLFPGRLEIALHDGLGDFEQWRVALGILPEWVTQGPQKGRIVLSATGRFAGVEVTLTGYAPLLKAVA